VLAKARADTGILGHEGVKLRRDRLGSYSEAYNSMLHEVRARLSLHFLELGEVLHNRASKAKELTSQVLREDGLLGALSTIVQMLEVAHGEALYRCETALADLGSEPNGAIFAVVEEFRDRVLRSKGVEQEWRIFYENARVEVWSGQFKALAENAELFRRWNEEVATLTRQVSGEPWLGSVETADATEVGS
jgi:hypothetical protein